MTKLPIDPRDFTCIPTLREMIRALPDGIQVCPEHGSQVTIQEGDFSVNPGPGAPFGEAAYYACCEPALRRVVDTLGRPPLPEQKN